MLASWLATVRTDVPRAVAIARFESPAKTRVTISRSTAVNDAKASGSASSGKLMTTYSAAPIARRVMRAARDFGGTEQLCASLRTAASGRRNDYGQAAGGASI